MDRKKVVIYGAGGTVGSVLANGLREEVLVIALKRENCDLTNFSQVMDKTPDDADTLIHMGWKQGNIYRGGGLDCDNILMTFNVLETAFRKQIPRVILASSVHANEYRDKKGPIKIGNQDWPTSVYGATKLYFEALGKYYAKKRKVEVVAVRLGGINPQDSPRARDEVDYNKVYLSHKDLVNTIRKVVEKESIPNDYSSFYLISDNLERIHSR